MNEKAKKARREYYRAYYQTHKAQRKKANEEYWVRRAERTEEVKINEPTKGN